MGRGVVKEEAAGQREDADCIKVYTLSVIK